MASLFEQLLDQTSFILSLGRLLFFFSLNYQYSSLVILDQQVHRFFVICALTISSMLLSNIRYDPVLDEPCTLAKPY